MLRDQHFKAVYRSDFDNILQDFYIPALSNSVLYERAVGFFSATVLSYAAQGLSALVAQGGQMRLIIGYELSAEDDEAINKGYELKALSERIGVSMVRTFDQVSDTLFARRLEALSWLIAAGKLEIKVALKRKGMYHEKIGIFTDSRGDSVVFQGSANETTYGLLPDYNFESINVFPSWKTELKEHSEPYVLGFQNLWADRVANTRVIDFPKAVKEKLIHHVEYSPRVYSVAQEIALSRQESVHEEEGPYEFLPKVPEVYKGYEFKLHAHQLAALNSWKASGCSGILEFATGAGKTLTAIYGATRLFEAAQRLFLVIAVPYQNLADQWVDELQWFGMSPIRCYVSSSQWQNKLNDAITRFNSGAQAFCCAVVVNATLSTPSFQSCLSRISGDSMMWIGDECHHHGSDRMFVALPSAAKIRLGLSATPSHYMNDAANLNIKNYYGSTVYKYSLKQALEDKVLTPYKYYVVPVELNEDEAQRYIDLSNKIAQAFKVSTIASDSEESPRLSQLLLARTRILASAESKLKALESLLVAVEPAQFTLFYCGDGRVEDPVTGDEERQIEMVSEMLHDRGWKSARFTAHEPRVVREQLLDHFRLRLIDGLVAIRCLDEGIDVPACRSAYLLASSRNPRQQIQRRGRILRRSEGKELAEIYDFLVMLPAAAVDTSDYERKLLSRELERVAEFASLALNHAEVVKCLLPILKKYKLTHFLSP